jgi:hypothetical protein
MAESFVEASLTNQDINQLAADGASNAIVVLMMLSCVYA